MLKDLKATLFDLDGTLVDSMWMWKDIDIEYLGRFQIALPPDLQKKIEGMSYTETAQYFLETFSLPTTIEQIKADWVEMAYDKYKNEVPLKPGVLEFLEYLKENGISMGIATSNSIHLVETILEVHGIRDYFGSIRTACDVPKGKPSPDIYLKVAADLGVSPSQCLVFEDVTMGILAGRNAGMRVCAVHDEFSLDQEKKKRELAQYYIQNYYQILEEAYEILT